jgi:chemotaxis protein methyltransferase CheR
MGRRTTTAPTTGQLRRLESALRGACGGYFTDRLRTRLRAHLEGAALELGLGPAELLPRVLAGTRGGLADLLEVAAAGETYFLRHPGQLALLRRLLFERADPAVGLRIWSAGCGSGEEPYSVAIMLLEAGRHSGIDTILATDVSDRALQHGQAAVYGRWSLRLDLGGLRQRYFLGERGRAAEVVPGVRRLVQFLKHDLVQEPPPSQAFDAVLCRNVLVHLEPGAAALVLRRLFGAVRPGGFLLLGQLESALAAQLPVVRVEEGAASVFRRPQQPTTRPQSPEPLEGMPGTEPSVPRLAGA